MAEVANQKKLSDLLKISDLNIFPWFSTTFFEALHFNADIFFVEEDIFEKPFEAKLKNIVIEIPLFLMMRMKYCCRLSQTSSKNHTS